MLAGGVVAAAVGMLAYRQMDDRSTEPMLPDLLAAVRRGQPRHGSGVLIAVEGAPGEQTAEQAARLAVRLRAPATRSSSPTAGTGIGSAGPRRPARRRCPVPGRRRWPPPRCAPTRSNGSSGRRWPQGAVVIVDRFLDSPLVQFGVAADRAGPSWIRASWTASRCGPPAGCDPTCRCCWTGRRPRSRRRRRAARRAARRGAHAGAAAAHPDGGRRAAPLRGRRRRRRRRTRWPSGSSPACNRCWPG